MIPCNSLPALSSVTSVCAGSTAPAWACMRTVFPTPTAATSAGTLQVSSPVICTLHTTSVEPPFPDRASGIPRLSSRLAVESFLSSDVALNVCLLARGR